MTGLGRRLRAASPSNLRKTRMQRPYRRAEIVAQERLPGNRHSRESGNPASSIVVCLVDSRFRGNDEREDGDDRWAVCWMIGRRHEACDYIWARPSASRLVSCELEGLFVEELEASLGDVGVVEDAGVLLDFL